MGGDEINDKCSKKSQLWMYWKLQRIYTDDISSLEHRVDREGENANASFAFCENSKRDDTGKLLGRPRSLGIILR